jgi:DNA polymerase-3 subunit delta'
LIPLIGHAAVRARISGAIERGTLPASLLFQGPQGAAKERLALWVGERLLCADPQPDGEPCGICQHCAYVARGVHPDLLWFFPRPHLKKSKPDADDMLADLAEAIEERLEKTGVWPPVAGTAGIYVPAIRALVQRAVLTPAMARRKVIVVADAHRLIVQEGNDEASNAFLKLLEEPLADTTIILTSSSPSSLLPTIRSRVVSVRIPPLSAEDRRELSALGITPQTGADAHAAAAAMLDAVGRDDATRCRTAFRQGVSGARGNYFDTLEALTMLLHERTRSAAGRGDNHAAACSARAVEVVEEAKRLTRTNVNPQLISATLLNDLAALMR